MNFCKVLPLRNQIGKWIKSPEKQQCMFPENRFCFLNKEGFLNDSSDWNNPYRDKLWNYNLHYFDYLNVPGDSDYISRCRALIERWVIENPPGIGNGWEPYPVSLRIVNWIKWHLCGNELSSQAIKSLLIQVCFLRKNLEYHLMANHLFVNAKALVFAGLFFEGKEAEEWLKRGMTIFHKEIPEQIMSDGGNFELSPMYHSIMVEDMLDLINIARCFNHSEINGDIIVYWKQNSRKMLDWLKVMCHGDGKIALFNDAAFGIAPQMEQLSLYAEQLVIKKIDRQTDNITELSNTGYIRVNRGDIVLIIDAGDVGPDYQPGHAHADTLSFELSRGNSRVIVDSGTSCYGTGPERLRQRGTAAHNTVNVDKQDSSEVWSGFRVARRARITERTLSSSEDHVIISAAHDGFKRIKGMGFHRRAWTVEDKRIIIEDSILGTGKHLVEAYLHFHPDLRIAIEQEKIVRIIDRENTVIKIYLDSNVDFFIENSTYHPEFGISIHNKKITCSAEVKLPFSFKTIFEM